MKKIINILFIGAAITVTSCKKYLDINANPNQATVESAAPELILPQAITGTASNLNGFNSYGSQIVGYMANAGGYGGFGTAVTYRFSSSDFQGRWSTTYDNLEDYQTIINLTNDKLPQYGYFNAAARIMKAYSFQLLVDAYNDVPYTEALLGAEKLTTKYDGSASIYVSLANQLDSAITIIKDANAASGVTPLGTSDVLFGDDPESWIKLANTLKLRLIIHAKDKAQFTNTSFSEEGFLTEDALINPGFKRDNGRQNPQWESWAFTYTLSAGNKAWMPNKFVFGFYNGTKLTDDGRGAAIYYDYPGTGTNQLGHEGNDVVSSPTGSFWYPGADRSSAPGNTTGVLKGPDAGYPAFLASESYFLQAEAVIRGIISGDAKTLFEAGIKSSFEYLYQLPDGSYSGTPDADAATYMKDNDASPLVNFERATTPAAQTEAIITQKYIALNFIHGHEAWNEYRRTHYPTIKNTAGANGYETFASTQSESTRPDKLPTRIMYPSTEGSLNTANVPRNIDPFSSFIFWALQ